MNSFHAPTRSRVEGIAFTIPELLILAAWADFHGLRMHIELDWHADAVEYEEVVSLKEPEQRSPSWFLWRTCKHVVLQPVLGGPRRFDTICAALTAICPETAVPPN